MGAGWGSKTDPHTTELEDKEPSEYLLYRVCRTPLIYSVSFTGVQLSFWREMSPLWTAPIPMQRASCGNQRGAPSSPSGTAARQAGLVFGSFSFDFFCFSLLTTFDL